MAERRFPPPWTVEEQDACFVLRDASGQPIAHVYCEEAAAKLLKQGRGAADRGKHGEAAGAAR
jgi:hypothetical protein